MEYEDSIATLRQFVVADVARDYLLFFTGDRSRTTTSWLDQSLAHRRKSSKLTRAVPGEFNRSYSETQLGVS
jgi:hypothetical protein